MFYPFPLFNPLEDEMTTKMSRRNMLKASVLATAGTIIAACTAATPEAVPPASDQPAAQPAEKQAYKAVLMYNLNEISDDEIAQFNANYAPYSVERIDTDLVKLFSMLAAGTQVDAVRLYGTYMPAYVSKKVALDLTNYFNASTITAVNDLLPVNDLFVVDGKRYGMVKDWSPDNSIWINKKLWGEAGVDVPTDFTQSISYQDFRAMSSKLTKREGDRTLVWGTDFTPNEHFMYWMSTTFAQPRHIFNEDFTKIVLLGDPDTYEAAKFVLEWKKEGGLPSAIHPFSSEGGWSGADWVGGQAATVQWGYWFGGMAESDQVPGEDIYAMVAPTYGPTYSNPCVSGCGMFVTSSTKNADASWKLFEWFNGELPAENRAKSGWGVPGLKSMLPLMPVDVPWRKQAYDVVQAEIAKTAVAVIEFTPYTQPSTFHSSWAKFETPYLQNEITLDEMLESIEKEVNISIEEGMDAAGV
jgi:multiple sugar transport system substrate-binding protein